MTGKEKVINALERCDLYELCVDDSCPYYREAACLEEVTYNRDKGEMYVDIYVKVLNERVPV